jgi:hypothetical protein
LIIAFKSPDPDGKSVSSARIYRSVVANRNAVIMPLSINCVCSKAVVRRAQIMVPEIEAWDQAPEGSVETRVLVQRTSIRKSARAFVEPLAHEGIDRIEIRVTDDDLLVIESDDIDAFNVPIPVESILTDEIKDMAVEVVQATLQGDYIWRLDEGDGPFSAHMADAEFIQRVKDRQVAFIAGDILFCQMRVRQWWENEKIHIDRTVIHVDRKVSPEDESDIDFRASFWGTDDAPDSFEQK